MVRVVRIVASHADLHLGVLGVFSVHSVSIDVLGVFSMHSVSKQFRTRD